MEPNVLVGGEEPCKLGTDDTNDIAQHRDKDETAIECEYQTGATRNPNREFEAVQTGKPGVRRLERFSAKSERGQGGEHAPGCTNRK